MNIARSPSSGTHTLPTLSLRNVTKKFGGVVALRELSFDVHQNEIVALIGANGSGKSTLFNTIAGFLGPTSGEIWWQGERIDSYTSEKVATRGIARSFQEAATFPRLTTRECFDIACRYEKRADQAMELVGMCHLADSVSGSLSYGLQRMLGIGLAAAMRPKLLLLDEPAAGLTYVEVLHVAKILKSLRGEGMTIIVVDHNMSFVLPLCERAIVLAAGQSIYDGAPEAVHQDPEVRRSYLGK